ncbi:ATP-binding protein [Streptomyces sp. NPDC049954]|uniref:ATP-binding protein n=1 Tax=Streptomyces sp. NPDC049954 TaxID=3155779 RepID=UPI00344537F7
MVMLRSHRPLAAPVARSAQLVMVSRPESVSLARRYAAETVKHLAPDCPDEQAYDVAVLVSELVTNAVRYGTEPGDSVLLALSSSACQVRIEVHDPSRRRPRRRRTPSQGQRGRGLEIVDALAQSWGTGHRPLGKFVWAVVRW